MLTDNAASQTVHENIEKRVETINSFCGGNIKNFANYNPFRGRYVFKMLDADTMICQINDSEKVIIHYRQKMIIYVYTMFKLRNDPGN